MKMVSSPRLRAPVVFNFATDVVDAWACCRPNSPALWCLDGKTGNCDRLTFAELSDLSTRAAGFFRSQGIGKGDRVLLMLPRIPQWWIAMLGLIRLGALPVPATLLLTSRDVCFRIETAAIQAVITDCEGARKVEGFGGVKIFAASGDDKGEAEVPAGWHSFARGLKTARASQGFEKTGSDDPGILFFTSATTGDPKMVLHTQASYGLGHRSTGEYWLDLKPGDIHWNVSDLGWAKAAWSSFFAPWQMGACVFAVNSAGKFDPGATLDVLEQFPITTWCAPPTALRLLVRQSLRSRKFPSLRHCVSAGEPLNPEVLNLWRDATGLTIHEGYGQTETTVLVANCRKLGYPVQPGSMGKPVPGMNVELINEDFGLAAPGEEGEIALRLRPERPLGLFKEYWLNAAEMAQKFAGDYYLTGDRAVQDEQGYFWFVGRKDDVIKSSGYRIGPFEVESALLEHRLVLDVAVIGKPDPLRGQIVKACVVLRDGCNGNDELKAELQTHCKRLVAAYKYPREIEFVKELPKTTSGKTRHRELRRACAPA